MSRVDVQSVYIARGLTSGLLKIGRTLKLRSRLKALATKSGEPVETLAVIVTGGLRENALHRQFAAHRTAPERGREWYADDGAILPYPKPLSVRRPDAPHLKDELSPDSLGLLPAPIAPQVARIIVLDRDPELGTAVELDELSVMDALFAVVEETSSLSWLDRPLHRLADLLEASGPVLRVRYAEASAIEGALAGLVGGSA